MGKYRTLGTFFDRIFRNDLNANFNDIDADVQAQKKRVDDLIVANPQPSEVQDARGGFTVLRDRLNDTDAQLAEKLSQGEVSVYDIDKTKGKLDQTYMTDEFLQQMAGTTPINSIPADESVTPIKTTFLVLGKNKLDKNAIVNGYYVNQSTGVKTASASHMIVEYIPIKPSVSYYLNGVTVRHAFYTSDKTFISGGLDITPVTAPSNAKYMSVSYSTSNNKDILQIEEGAAQTSYEPYGFRPDYGKVKIELYDEDIYDLKSITYVPYSISGKVLSDTAITSTFKGWSGAFKFVSEFDAIRVRFNAEINGDVTVGVHQSMSSAPVYSKTISAKSGSHNYLVDFGQLITSSIGSSFFISIKASDNNRLNIPSLDIDDAVIDTSKSSYYITQGSTSWVVAGSGRHIYAEFINSKQLKNIKEVIKEESRTKITEALIPANIYGLVGKEVNIYFDSLNLDDYKKYNFDITCDIGTQQNERFTVIPSTAGTYPITIDIFKGIELIKTLTSNIVVKSANVGTGVEKSVITIGDSLIGHGYITGELVNLFGADAMNLVLKGTEGTAPNLHEGRSGWSTSNYVTNVFAAYNPFWNSTTSKFDFSLYMSNQGYTSVDYVLINLGINDMSGYTDDATLKKDMPKFLANLQTMIDSVHAYNPNVKVGVFITPQPSYHQDAFGKSYGTGRNQWRYKRNAILWVKTMVDYFKGKEASNIYLVPVNVNLDTEHNMPTETVPVNSRNSQTIVRQNNGVHPAESGYYQMSDMVYYWLKSFEV